jgi:glycosyltransferase involved in cell wall biosynthesis
MTPTISIIVPCYNQAHYLDEALKSVLAQTYPHWECIIVNDGSSDNTAEIANNWVEKDKRFRYLFQNNSGLSSSRNLGIKNTLGKFILPLDADDKISNQYLELALKAFEEDNSLKIVYSKAEKFGLENGLWYLRPFSKRNLCYFNMIFCSAFFRKKDWEMVGGYDEKMIYGWEDWEFWIAILKNGGSVKCLNHIGFFYRTKQVSMATQLNIEKTKLLAEYMSVKHADFYVNHLGSFLHLNDVALQAEEKNSSKLKSKKYVIDIFCYTFFRFKIFNTY